MYIQYFNWYKKYKKFFNTCEDVLKLKSCQFYYPIFSLFFNIRNTDNSHKSLDLKRRYILNEIFKKTDNDDYNSNCCVDCNIYDTIEKKDFRKNIFVKQISILDINHIILNHYNLLNPRNNLLPSNYNYNTYDKINKIDNCCYIDCFFSFIVGTLNDKNILPNFSKYYGCVNGISNHKVDVTEDIQDFESYEQFEKGLKKIFDVNVYTNSLDKLENMEIDSNSDKDSEELKKDSENMLESEEESDSESDTDSEDDYIIEFKNIPVINLFLEKLDGTLEELLTQETYDANIIIGCLFQISFSLYYLQEQFKFIHNDLHINNIMYVKTSEEFLYYKLKDKYYKIPTNGYIFKIIDFGRCIFTFKGRLYLNDSFSKHGEADTQYDYTNEKFNPNYNFDLCRLSTTILDELNEIPDDHIKDKVLHNKLIDLLLNMIKDKDDNYIYDGTDNSFQLYVDITNKSVNSLPIDILQNEIFNCYISSKVDNKYFTID